MLVSPRRGAVGLALTALTAAALSPAAHADNLEADSLVGGVASLGTVCAGAKASGSVGFALKRNGNGNVWANSATVVTTPTSQPAGMTLGSATGGTPSNWTTRPNNTLADGGDAAVAVDVPLGTAPGAKTVEVVYSASGPAQGGGTNERPAIVTFSWTVIDCTPADTTAPVISKVVSPAAPDGANGWYTSDVSIDWTVSDPESQATATGCQDASLRRDGTLTSTCSATSKGGSAGPVSVTVKRDSTPPEVEPVVSGDLGEDGWYVGDVTVSWKASDATSQIDPETVCAPSELRADTAQETYKCTVSDLAGNVASASVAVKRDASDPVIVKTVSGTLGEGGWYTSDVDISFDVSDATSEIASAAGCDGVTLDQDTAGETWTCTATDVAGNSASATVDVKRDATAPDVTFTRDGDEGTNGWYRGPVVLAWTVSDALSGSVVTQGCVDRTVSVDGRDTYPCSATDAAGNTATASAAVDIDATAPVVTVAVTGDTKGTEWFTGDATVTWTATDATSGGAVPCATTTVTTDGTHPLSCTAADAAGNTGTREVTVLRDATAPVLTVTGGPANGATYDFGDVPAASTCTASDATSGVDGACGVSGAGSAVGAHTQVATVRDKAGNVATENRTYAVAAWRLDGFYKPVTMGTAVVNTVKAGSTVPLKFNVYKGSAAMTSGIAATFTTSKVGCESGDVEDAVELVTTGGTSLRYDASGQQWVQNWATPSAGKNSCYRVTLKTQDGSSRVADFKLK